MKFKNIYLAVFLLLLICGRLTAEERIFEDEDILGLLLGVHQEVAHLADEHDPSMALAFDYLTIEEGDSPFGENPDADMFNLLTPANGLMEAAVDSLGEEEQSTDQEAEEKAQQSNQKPAQSQMEMRLFVLGQLVEFEKNQAEKDLYADQFIGLSARDHNLLVIHGIDLFLQHSSHRAAILELFQILETQLMYEIVEANTHRYWSETFNGLIYGALAAGAVRGLDVMARDAKIHFVKRLVTKAYGLSKSRMQGVTNLLRRAGINLRSRASATRSRTGKIGDVPLLSGAVGGRLATLGNAGSRYKAGHSADGIIPSGLLDGISNRVLLGTSVGSFVGYNLLKELHRMTRESKIPPSHALEVIAKLKLLDIDMTLCSLDDSNEVAFVEQITQPLIDFVLFLELFPSLIDYELNFTRRDISALSVLMQGDATRTPFHKDCITDVRTVNVSALKDELNDIYSEISDRIATKIRHEKVDELATGSPDESTQ